jgi:hypothetical protein
VKTNHVFHINVYPVDQLLFVTTIPVLLNQVSVARTVPVVIVHDVGKYSILAVGSHGSTSKSELAAPLIVPSLTRSVTHVFACVKIVFNGVVDCPAVKDTQVVYIGIPAGHVYDNVLAPA